SPCLDVKESSHVSTRRGGGMGSLTLLGSDMPAGGFGRGKWIVSCTCKVCRLSTTARPTTIARPSATPVPVRLSDLGGFVRSGRATRQRHRIPHPPAVVHHPDELRLVSVVSRSERAHDPMDAVQAEGESRQASASQ